MQNEMIMKDGQGGLLVRKDLIKNLVERNGEMSDAISYLLDRPHTGSYVSLDKLVDLLKGAVSRKNTSSMLRSLVCDPLELPDIILEGNPLEADIARARLSMPGTSVGGCKAQPMQHTPNVLNAKLCQSSGYRGDSYVPVMKRKRG